ncbi:Chaperone DnaJ [Carpediemonas membranifera]|uniref:Chaperone DnaJ n=1 Tax=Carpediemonas membranifera TaxID=201153 RepID=A0A8J6DZW2_9EUKA|nr:Chaperone DnaJ [Carpediemonas membranifera]|eukprot:KAG9394209.1 Chaperone DnaJ [Carpediemonas membranifera]
MSMSPPKALFLLICVLILLGIVYCDEDQPPRNDEPGYDYYAVLGVPHDIPYNSPELKKIYRRMSFMFHPDRNPGDTEAQRNFMEISAAYETLSDPEKKHIYDTQGPKGLRGEGTDIFSQLFGGRKQNTQQETVKEITLPNLDAAFTGLSSTVNIDHQGQCPACHGTGAKSSKHIHKCSHCNGTGRRVEVRQLGPGIMQQVQTVCGECGGRGQVVKKACSECGGHGVVRSTEEVLVSVKPGAHDGEKLRFPGMGSTNDPRQPPGDLVLVVRVPEHEFMTRRGDQLHTDLTISLTEALVGFERELPHLAGRTVKVGADGVTVPGAELIVKGEGMPNRRFPSWLGDLHVHVTVEFPESVSDEQRSIIRSFGESV